MKKVIVGSLAVIGGITVGFTVLVGIASAVQAARAKKKYESMTPEEREERKKRMDAMMGAILAAYGVEQNEAATEEIVEAPTAEAEATA